MRPVTPQQFLDIGQAEPLTVTGMVGGWRVDVHGTALAQVVMCLTPMAGDPPCAIADDWMDIDVAGGSVVIDGQWGGTTTARRAEHLASGVSAAARLA